MIAKPLSGRQRELFDFIVKHTDDNGFQPSYEDMMSHMLVASPNAIRELVMRLERKGYVARTGKSRAMQILLREY